MGVILFSITMCFVIVLAIGIVSAIVYWKDNSVCSILVIIACICAFIIVMFMLIKNIPVFHM